MIEGPWFITRAALDDFARLAGAGRDELLDEIARAHFVKRQGDGAEIWRGGKPLRLRFVLRVGQGAGGDAPQLVRVEGDHAARLAPRARRVVVRDGQGSETALDVTDQVLDPGPARRVAYRLTSGHWVTGLRGRSSPDQVLELSAPLQNTPDWVRELRGQAERRGGRGK